MQINSQIGASYNIELKDKWFTPDLEDDQVETPRHKLRSVPKQNNKNNVMASLIPKTRVYAGPSG